MLNSIRAKTFAAFTLGLAAALMPMRQADAAMFVGTFDPAFGPAFPRLGFNGTATFEISEACLAQPGTFCTTAPIDMLSATVTLYDLLNPSNTEFVNFGFTSLLNVYTQSGRPFGVNSEIIGPVPGALGDNNDGFIYSGSVFLQFQLDFGEAGVGIPSAFIFACPASSPQCSSGEAIQSNRAVLSFVPEPGSAALVLVALAAAARVRRRLR